MGIMDLSINQEAMGVQSKFGSHVFQLKEYNETDVKGNNNLYNSRKTDTSNDPSSLFRDGYSSENLHVDPSLFSYSSFKKAMDLRMHNRRDDESTRTIFDDADYFAKNFFYKLLPITFEQVDETIIQSEHNYSLCSLNSESEAEEDCSRTMDYSQIKEKNYKRRRTKFRDGSDAEQAEEEEWDENELRFDSNQNIPNQKECAEPEPEPENAMQPLDLSAAPPVQEQKTDHHSCHLREEPDSVEDNLQSKLNWIRVTITRPDEKENYQPCDMFLNDIARLVPRLINNDCFEINILDKTGNPHDDLHAHRLYYIIAQSTWRLFQSTSERVILTNDYTIGPPVKKIEKDERPTFLVFDQFSLAKCLADYCQEIGGCFEYTCVEEEKENEQEEVVKIIEGATKAEEKVDENEEVTEMAPKETTVEIDTKVKTRTDETNTKPETVAGEITNVLEDFKMDIEATNMDYASTVLEMNLGEAEAGSDFTAIKSEKFVEDEKTKKMSVGEIKNVDLERNETEENVRETVEIKMTLSGNLEQKESKTNESRKKQRKMAVKNQKRKRKSKIGAEDLQSIKVEGEVKVNEVEVDIKTKAETVIPSHVENSEPGKIDAKATKSIETNTEVNVSESTETKIERSIENEKEREKYTKKTKAEEKQIKKIDTVVRSTKSYEKNEETVGNENVKEEDEKIVDVQLIKRRGKKFIKKKKKGREIRERKADVVQAEDAKKDTKEKEIEIKRKKAKEADTNSKGKKTNNVSAKGRKGAKMTRKPFEEGKKSENLDAKNKEKRPQMEKTKNPPPKKIRSKIKSKDDPPVAQPQVKTRSKSTSESETSQKPNKEIKKTKVTVKEPSREVEKIKESTERKTRSGKAMAEKKEDVKVKENGMRMRGKKRKLEEGEVLGERCLRSRGEKVNVDKANTPSKRRKR